MDLANYQIANLPVQSHTKSVNSAVLIENLLDRLSSVDCRDRIINLENEICVNIINIFINRIFQNSRKQAETKIHHGLATA